MINITNMKEKTKLAIDGMKKGLKINEDSKSVKTGLMLTNLHLAMLAVILFLIATVGYLYGKTQQIQPAGVKQEPTIIQQAIPIISPTFTPETNTVPKQVIYLPTPTPSPTPIPPERKKVSTYVDDNGGLTKGNFYCYEDKVNELSDIQNQIRINDIVSDSCMESEQSKALQCSSSCSTQPDIASCVDACYANVIPNCNDKNTKSGDLRKELYNKVHQYCP